MIFALFPLAGLVAGHLGARLLHACPRGAVPAAGCCELGVAAAWALAAAGALAGTPPWWLPVPLLLGWAGVLLAVCDLKAARLPDVLTLPAYPVVAVLLAAAAAHRPGLLPAAVAGGALFAGAYLAVRLLRPAALGAGDVKLAGSLGAVVGAVSVPLVPVVMAAAAVATLPAARARIAVPHAPAMLVPAWLVTAFPVVLAW
nr:A24 family peptidase [Saccharopolyspora sp. HNM0983]